MMVAATAEEEEEEGEDAHKPTTHNELRPKIEEKVQE